MQKNFHSYPSPDKNFVEYLKVVDSIPGFTYFAFAGTLLGLTREKDLIEWDHDVDLVMLPKSNDAGGLEKLKLAMCASGFSVTTIQNGLQFSRPGGRKIDLQYLSQRLISGQVFFVLEWQVFRTNFSNPIWNVLSHIFSKFEDVSGSRFATTKVIAAKLGFYNTMQYRVSSQYFKHTKTLDYFGRPVVVPEKGDLVLEELYGTSWQTPQRSKYWHFFSKPAEGEIN